MLQLEVAIQTGPPPNYTFI